MIVHTKEELTGLQEIGHIVAFVLQEMLQAVEVGLTTQALDVLGAALLAEYGARSAPRLCYDFPGATCISVNEEIAHGIPGERVIQAGDIVNIDVSAEKNGFFGDTGGTVAVAPVSEASARLIASTREALNAALREVSDGQPLNVIGKAIESCARSSGFKVVRNLCSHGVGRSLHEGPAHIPGYFDPRDTRRLREGMVITIEPFLSTASNVAFESSDGWTLRNTANGRSAQFEHSLMITKQAPVLLTVVPSSEHLARLKSLASSPGAGESASQSFGGIARKG